MKNNYLKHLFTALLLLCSTIVFAETVVVDGITYDLVKKAKIATVIASEIGYTGDVVVPETVEYDGTTYCVTSIGESAFENCTGLTNIVIPNSVTSIEYATFRGCTGLTSIVIPNSITSIGSCAYARCYDLTSIEIPNSITSIGSYAFENCTGLTSIEIPNSVTSIEYATFRGCTGLTSIEIPNSITSIKRETFVDCSSLSSVVIPNSVTSIGQSAFSGCTSLISIEIPGSVTSIGEFAFVDCSGLTSIEIPNNVTSIEYATFLSCTSLTSIKIPNSVTSIGQSAFSGCTSLTSIKIPNSVTSFGDDVFYGCDGLKRVELDCENIGSWFRFSTIIGELVIPIEELVIGNNVKSIGEGAFRGCEELRSVVIGNNVKSIGDGAFADCEELLDVYCFAPAVPATETNAFDGSYPEYINLHVPTETLESYRTTEPWSTFGNIVPLAFDLTVTTAGYATLYLDYAVEIPDGVKVYTANSVEGDRLKMQPVEGVIPANTGVIVKANAGTYTFTSTTDTTSPIAGNLFKGSVENEMVKVSRGSQAYVLSMVDGEVGMYRAELTDGSFLNNANKAYLLLTSKDLGIYDEEYDTSTGGQLSNGFRFDFGGTTGIDEVKGENGDVKTIYDLQGRKVENPTSGIYIVNGKKVLVK